MDSNQQYYACLEKIDENLADWDADEVGKLLSDLFLIKPVRLKWYLVKAKLMLKMAKPIDEIIAFLADKCMPWYLYEDVEEWFVLMSALHEYGGNLTESRKYLYQLNRLCGEEEENREVDEQIAEMEHQLEAGGIWECCQIAKLINLYYISGNYYLCLLWQVVEDKLFGRKERKSRTAILNKVNVEYYYERLISDYEENFVIFTASENDERHCRLAKRALEVLGKRTVLFDKPSNADELLEYAVKDGGMTCLATVLGSGLILENIASMPNVKPKMERLTEAETDYMDDKIAVGRYGDYLAFIANIFMTTREKIEYDLYKKPTCRFSIIIPCRNDGDTLRYTLKTCLNQTFSGEYEIVVSDNSDRSWGKETPVYRICQEFQNERIKYYRTPRNFSLMKSFEWAYLRAEGEFLISMGADDGILPWALEELDRVLVDFSNKQVLLWEEAFYIWPGMDERFSNNKGAQLSFSTFDTENQRNFYDYSPLNIWLYAVKDYGAMYFLPQLYHNCGIRRQYLSRLYEVTGVLWDGINQDICMAITVANIEKEICFLKNTLTITGASNASIGINSQVGHNDLEQKDFLSIMNGTFCQGYRVQSYFERLFPLVGGNYCGLYACIMYVYAIGIISDEMLNKLDMQEMYKTVVGEILKEDILADAKIHRLRYAVSLVEEELLQWFDENLYKEALYAERQESVVQRKSRFLMEDTVIINGKQLKAEPDSISNVYQAAHLLEKYFKEGAYEK